MIILTPTCNLFSTYGSCTSSHEEPFLPYSIDYKDMKSIHQRDRQHLFLKTES